MVPKDRPLHALDLLRRFLAGGGYDKVPRADAVEPRVVYQQPFFSNRRDMPKVGVAIHSVE